MAKDTLNLKSISQIVFTVLAFIGYNISDMAVQKSRKMMFYYKN